MSTDGANTSGRSFPAKPILVLREPTSIINGTPYWWLNLSGIYIFDQISKQYIQHFIYCIFYSHFIVLSSSFFLWSQLEELDAVWGREWLIQFILYALIDSLQNDYFRSALPGNQNEILPLIFFCIVVRT
jgi:hypothetical protein